MCREQMRMETEKVEAAAAMNNEICREQMRGEIEAEEAQQPWTTQTMTQTLELPADYCGLVVTHTQ